MAVISSLASPWRLPWNCCVCPCVSVCVCVCDADESVHSIDFPGRDATSLGGIPSTDSVWSVNKHELWCKSNAFSLLHNSAASNKLRGIGVSREGWEGANSKGEGKQWRRKCMQQIEFYCLPHIERDSMWTDEMTNNKYDKLCVCMCSSSSSVSVWAVYYLNADVADSFQGKA